MSQNIPDDNTIAAMLKDATQAYSPPAGTKEAVKAALAQSTQTSLRRTIMKRHWPKLAAAAVIIVAVVLSITILEKSPTVAYALEQTIQANHSVRTIHIKRYIPENEQPEEYWAEFDETGQLLRCRIEAPKTEDGPKTVLWQDDKAEVWFKAKNSHVIINDKTVALHWRSIIEEIDPKLGIKRLEERQANKEVEVEIEEPSKKGQSIRLTVLYLENSQTPGRRLILQIDPVTKFLTQIEHYELVQGDYQLESRQEILGYNQPIDPLMFTLQVPDDVIRIDQVNNIVGLEKGDLSDDEISVKVAREFFEALIAKDYAKAGQLYEGMPAAQMEKFFGHINFIRIVSVGQVSPHPIVLTRFLCVPCEVEIEVDGKKFIKKFTPNIRAVYGQPNRWGIGGGI